VRPAYPAVTDKAAANRFVTPGLISCIIYVRGGRPVRHQKPHFISVLLQKPTSYTRACINTSPSLPHSYTYLCSVTFAANITHQCDDDRTLQAIYCHARYCVGLPVIIYARAAWTEQWTGCGSRAAVWPSLIHIMHFCLWYVWLHTFFLFFQPTPPQYLPFKKYLNFLSTYCLIFCNLGELISKQNEYSLRT